MTRAPRPQALIFNHLYDPISLVRDNEVKAAMLGLGVHCQSFNGDVLYEPWEVLGEGGRPLTSFDFFWGRCAWRCLLAVALLLLHRRLHACTCALLLAGCPCTPWGATSAPLCHVREEVRDARE